MEVVEATRREVVLPSSEEAEVEETAALQPRKQQRDPNNIMVNAEMLLTDEKMSGASPGHNIDGDDLGHEDGEGSSSSTARNMVYFENEGGLAVGWRAPDEPNSQVAEGDVSDIQKALDASVRSGKKREEISVLEERDRDEEEEVLEFEFERAIPKLHTHTMHCPNCNSHITKVILRRKRVISNPITSAPPSVKQEEPVGMLGCLSCFSIFVPTGNGFNCFNIFGDKKTKDTDVVDASSGDHISAAAHQEHGDCFSMFRVFGNKSAKDTGIESRPSLITAEAEGHKQPPKEKDAISSNIKDDAQSELKDGRVPRSDGRPAPSDDGVTVSDHFPTKPGKDGESFGDVVPPLATIVAREPDVRVDVPDEPGLDEGEEPLLGHQRINPSETNQTGNGGSNKPLEILKSVVYGGLMESIASLCVVSSAAASDATTLNIIALALANLIGGLFIIGHNLWDLRDDCYRQGEANNINETNDGGADHKNKYNELLGRVENFPVHATFAILSFLVFGLIPPLTYGYSFRGTNDRDLKLLAVAAASFLSVVFLAIGKAYVSMTPKFLGYLKIVAYYVTEAVMVSGVSYAAGDLVRKYVEELGWFDTGSAPTLSLIPGITSGNRALAF